MMEQEQLEQATACHNSQRASLGGGTVERLADDALQWGPVPKDRVGRVPAAGIGRRVSHLEVH